MSYAWAVGCVYPVDECLLVQEFELLLFIRRYALWSPEDVRLLCSASTTSASFESSETYAGTVNYVAFIVES